MLFGPHSKRSRPEVQNESASNQVYTQDHALPLCSHLPLPAAKQPAEGGYLRNSASPSIAGAVAVPTRSRRARREREVRCPHAHRDGMVRRAAGARVRSTRAGEPLQGWNGSCPQRIWHLLSLCGRPRRFFRGREFCGICACKGARRTSVLGGEVGLFWSATCRHCRGSDGHRRTGCRIASCSRSPPGAFLGRGGTQLAP